MKEEMLNVADLLIKHKLSANQYFFLYLKHKNQEERLYTYLETVRKLSKEELFDLEERGFIVNANPSAEDYWADRFLVTPKFAKIVDPDLSTANEFWEAYPNFIYINGRRTSLKAIDKDSFLFLYADFVHKDPKLHARILKALRYQKGSGEVNMRIDKWFKAKLWESVEKELQDLQQVKHKIYGQQEI
jgi:hypothetical protein